ncbi:S8 family serine peptidase, partial [candidate division GN15 bacterium]|nr:S8 family serine peptidase [candidate division GN15 bacterium]
MAGNNFSTVIRHRLIPYLLAAVLLILAGADGMAAERTGPVPGRFVVKLAPRANPGTIAQSLGSETLFERLAPSVADKSLSAVETIDRYYLFQRPDSQLQAADVVAALGADRIEHIEPDYHLQLFEIPDDALFDNQWGLYNTGQSYLAIERLPGLGDDSLTLKSGVAGKDINLAPFYFTPPAQSTSVVVAIIDSGADLGHPELQGRFFINDDEIPYNGLDDDHNGFVDDTLGYDMSGDELSIFDITPDNNPTDSNGHGTHIAGIIAANDNADGVIGVSPSVKILPIKILPNATSAVGAAGIIYAVNAGAKVLNLSFGSPYESLLLQDAITYARANGVMVVAASGNSGQREFFYPANAEGAFTVGAGNSSGEVTYFSTYGEHIDLIAPGQDILSLRAAGTDMYAVQGEPYVRIIGPDSLYYLSDGTSMAAPMVVGAAARLWSYRPDLSLDELEEILRLGATDLIDPFNVGDTLVGFDSISGYGYLNVAGSFALLDQGGIQFVSPQPRSRHTGPVTIRIAAVAGYTGEWFVDWSVGLESTDWQPLDSGLFIPPDSIAHVFDRPDTAGFINLRLRDGNGRSRIVTFIYSPTNTLELTSPAPGNELQYGVPISGSAFGPDFDSLGIDFFASTTPWTRIFATSAEYFDSLLYVWNLSGVESGEYTIVVSGYFGDSIQSDSVTITILNAFAAGWPQQLPGRGAQTPVSADLDRDGRQEVIAATGYGLYVFHDDGTVVDGFPV